MKMSREEVEKKVACALPHVLTPTGPVVISEFLRGDHLLRACMALFDAIAPSSDDGMHPLECECKDCAEPKCDQCAKPVPFPVPSGWKNLGGATDHFPMDDYRCPDCAKPKPETDASKRYDVRDGMTELEYYKHAHSTALVALGATQTDRDSLRAKLDAAEKRVECQRDIIVSDHMEQRAKKLDLAERRLEIARDFIENAAKYSDEYPTKDGAVATLKRIDGAWEAVPAAQPEVLVSSAPKESPTPLSAIEKARAETDAALSAAHGSLVLEVQLAAEALKSRAESAEKERDELAAMHREDCKEWKELSDENHRLARKLAIATEALKGIEWCALEQTRIVAREALRKIKAGEQAATEESRRPTENSAGHAAEGVTEPSPALEEIRKELKRIEEKPAPITPNPPPETYVNPEARNAPATEENYCAECGTPMVSKSSHPDLCDVCASGGRR